MANASRLEDEIPPIDDLQSETKSRTVTKAGRVVFLDDIAYTTYVHHLYWIGCACVDALCILRWKAFIFYSYFEELNFAPLKSEHKTRQRDEDPGNAPLCSPKSMYRLADKVRLTRTVPVCFLLRSTRAYLVRHCAAERQGCSRHQSEAVTTQHPRGDLLILYLSVRIGYALVCTD